LIARLVAALAHTDPVPPPEVPGEGPDPTGPDADVPTGHPIAGDPTGTHDDLPPQDRSLDDLGIVIPDDPSALEQDRQELLDEQARSLGLASSRALIPREPPPGLPRFLTARWNGIGPSAPMVIAILLAVAVIGSFMTFLAPSNQPLPGPQPLAQAPTGLNPGEKGALLPPETVVLDGVTLDLQRVRPVALAVIPKNCTQCEEAISNVQQQSREFGLRLMLVGTADQSEQLQTLSKTATNRLADVVIEPDGGLATQYRSTVPTLVLVHSDGIIGSVIRDPAPRLRLELSLASLAQPAGTPSTT
jgi:hypothetical protein